MLLVWVHVDNMAGGGAHSRGEEQQERRQAFHGALRMHQVQKLQQGVAYEWGEETYL